MQMIVAFNFAKCSLTTDDQSFEFQSNSQPACSEGLTQQYSLAHW